MANNWITHVLKHAPVKESELLMLIILADAATKKGSCWMSNATLAGLMRMSERSMPRIARVLEEKKCIKVNRRKRWNGSDSSNGYQLLAMANDPRVTHVDDTDDIGEGVTDDIPGMTQMTSQRVSQMTSLEPSIEPSTEPTHRTAVVVVQDAASGEFDAVGEVRDAATADREGKESVSVEAVLPSIPGSAAPLTPTACAIVDQMCLAYPRYVRRPAAERLISAYGEARVGDVWQYVKDNAATLRAPIAFMRSELATPFYVPLVAESVTPANDPTEIDEAEIETQTDAVSVDASVETLVDGKETAARKWSVVANQILLKGFRGIKDAQLVGYDASTQTYTVQVPSAHVQQQLSHRNGKTVRATLTGLHAGASVVFVTKEVRHGAS